MDSVEDFVSSSSNVEYVAAPPAAPPAAAPAAAAAAAAQDDGEDAVSSSDDFRPPPPPYSLRRPPSPHTRPLFERGFVDDDDDDDDEVGGAWRYGEVLEYDLQRMIEDLNLCDDDMIPGAAQPAQADTAGLPRDNRGKNCTSWYDFIVIHLVYLTSIILGAILVYVCVNGIYSLLHPDRTVHRDVWEFRGTWQQVIPDEALDADESQLSTAVDVMGASEEEI